MDRYPDPVANLGLNHNYLPRAAILPLLSPASHLLVNGHLPLTREALAAVPEYSTSLPTGTRPGKVWKRQDRRGWRWLDSWTLGTYGEPYPEGYKHHGSIPINWFPIRVMGQPASFPREVRIPAPAIMRGLPGNAPVGTDEGHLCLRSDGGRDPCLGVIEYRPDETLEGCGCPNSPMPPCSYCTSTMPECPTCGWRDEG